MREGDRGNQLCDESSYKTSWDKKKLLWSRTENILQMQNFLDNLECECLITVALIGFNFLLCLPCAIFMLVWAEDLKRLFGTCQSVVYSLQFFASSTLPSLAPYPSPWALFEYILHVTVFPLTLSSLFFIGNKFFDFFQRKVY